MSAPSLQVCAKSDGGRGVVFQTKEAELRLASVNTHITLLGSFIIYIIIIPLKNECSLRARHFVSFICE